MHHIQLLQGFILCQMHGLAVSVAILYGFLDKH